MNTTKNYNKLLFNLKKLKRYFFYNKSYLFISISYISISFFLFIFLNFASRNVHTMWHYFYENTQMIIFLKADANLNELNDLKEKINKDNISIKIVSKEEAIKIVSDKNNNFTYNFPDLSFSNILILKSNNSFSSSIINLVSQSNIVESYVIKNRENVSIQYIREIGEILYYLFGLFTLLLIFFSIRNFVKGFYMRFSKELKLYMQEGESITLLRVLNYIFFTIILSFSLIVSFYSTNILSEFIIANVNKYTENFLFPLVLKEVSETTVFLTFLIGLLSLIINSYKIASKIYNFPKI